MSDNGNHDGNGRFTAGNVAGAGNPHARRVGRLRSLLLEAVGEDDLKAIVAAMVERAKGGDLAAAREVLDRCVGKAGKVEQADPDRLDLDERALDQERRGHDRRDEVDALLDR